MSYNITWKNKCAYWHFYGTLTGEEALQSHVDVYGDPRFEDIRYKLVDFTDVSKFETSEDSLKRVAFMDKAAAHTNSRIAMLIVANTDEAKEILATYAKHSKGIAWSLKTYDTLDAAEAWLSDKD